MELNLLEKLLVAQLLKNYRVYRIPPMVTVVNHVNLIHTTHRSSGRCILILSSHLRLGLCNGLVLDYPPKPCMHLSSIRVTFHEFIVVITFGEEYRLLV
jgi:hypothetical protein